MSPSDSGERLRPGAGADRPRHRPASSPAIGADRGQPLAVEAEPERAGLHDLAAVAPELLDETGHEAVRVARVPVLAHQQAAHILARQHRFELAQFVGVEFVDFDAVLAPQRPGQRVFRQRFGRTVDVQMAALMDQILGAGVARQFAHQRHGRRDQRPQRARLRPHLVRRRRAHHPREIRQDRRQIGPAQRQRPERVHQPARHVADEAGERDRRHRRAVERPGIAERGALAGIARLDQKDAVPVALQPARGADPDHAGPDHPDPPPRACRHLACRHRAPSRDRPRMAAACRARNGGATLGYGG